MTQDSILRRTMRRNPIEYFARNGKGGMTLRELWITADEDPLPYIRWILLSEEFLMWPYPGATERLILKDRLAPYGNDASRLLGEPARQLELFVN